jgi:tryptophan 2,3-dioxygenase
MQTPFETSGAASRVQVTETRLSCPFSRTSTFDAALDPSAAVVSWLSAPNADEFPYETVLKEFHRAGKHFVSTTLLDALAAVRATLSEVNGSGSSVRLVERFLDVVLDKRDGRFSNPTYLALSLLPLPTLEDHGLDITAAEQQYDRLLVQLIADAMRFEVAAAEGATNLMPEMRPDARITAKRCRLGLQAARPALRRLGLQDGSNLADSVEAARHLWSTLVADLSHAERRTLELTMLPVSLIHDEYQFIRVLQSYEATFALVAVQLETALRALADGNSDVASLRIEAAASVLRDAAPLFSLVATMRVEAFQTFRVYTEGASAIQSRNYKIVESLCRQPDAPRLGSVAYHSVPEVRERVVDGQATLDGVFDALCASGRLSSSEAAGLEQAMRQFATALLRWRRTHYRLAVRMLGERTGTGYTEGTPYLKAAQSIPVFPSLAIEEDAEAREFDAGEAVATRCPWSGTSSVLDRAASGPFGHPPDSVNIREHFFQEELSSEIPRRIAAHQLA